MARPTTLSSTVKLHAKLAGLISNLTGGAADEFVAMDGGYLFGAVGVAIRQSPIQGGLEFFAFIEFFSRFGLE